MSFNRETHRAMAALLKLSILLVPVVSGLFAATPSLAQSWPPPPQTVPSIGLRTPQASSPKTSPSIGPSTPPAYEVPSIGLQTPGALPPATVGSIGSTTPQPYAPVTVESIGISR